MINLNVTQLTESNNRVNTLLNQLLNAALLYILGVVDAPNIGETVCFIFNGVSYTGVVKSVNLVDGTATVSYTHTVTRYRKEGGDESDSKSWKSTEYSVPFNAEEKTSDTFEFRYLEF